VAALRAVADGAVPLEADEDLAAGGTRVLPVESTAATQVVDSEPAAAAPWQPRWAGQEPGVAPDAGPPPPPAEWPPVPDVEAVPIDEVVLPEPRRRPGTLLALGLAALAAGTTWPGPTLLVAALLAVLVRSIGLDVDAHHTRRIQRGPRGSDGLRAVVSWPWYLLRAVLGVLPAALVAASAFVLVGGVGWWLLGSGRLLLVEAAADDAGALGPNSSAVRSGLVALAVLVALLTFWFGPAGWATRRGTRWTLAGVAPGTGGAVVVVLLALAGAAVLASFVLAGRAIEWWPLAGPPSL